ncbi:hypothetical protein DNH61_11760 [Paenibacillus sambharensis]|uniref:SGNH hydrolase-type esterase domain-containing protein n=1 Tax=Paenibacillus sambharensis TaxID=1803190 RepID=A0A2W1L8S9_9BACL|nr:GDSL-type esterase/lipase family protein [Paenibacillus sambharensis]PZD95229.1 hypothetical protein DNH61_11760 [Paenibacillus sambharensis]
MPIVTVQPRKQATGEIVSEFVDSVGPSATTWTYPTPQNHIYVRNEGTADITVTVGLHVKVIKPGKSWSDTLTFTSLKINAATRSQPFVLRTIQYERPTIASFGDTQAPAGYSSTVLLVSLNNPFEYTGVAFIGDSITAGYGGTGYTNTSAGGDMIFGNYWYVNTNGYCWSNETGKYLVTKYNRDFIVPVTHERIIFTNPQFSNSGYTSGNPTNTRAIGRKIATLPNIGAGDKVSCTYYGDHFGVYFSYGPDRGIVEIYVDGNLVQTVDTYASAATYKQLISITGLPMAQHEVEIRETNRKNASASQNAVIVEGFVIQKVVKAWNRGTAGVDSRWLAHQALNVLPAGELITHAIVQVGTNDRIKISSTQETTLNVLEIVEKLRSANIKPILMSSIPAGTTNEEQYSIHMEDIDNAIAAAAKILGIDYISNYHGFLDYCDLKGVTIESYLPDKLHPGDAGYTVMLNHILYRLGQARKRDGATW